MNWNNIYKEIISLFILIIPFVFAQNDETIEIEDIDDISILKDIKEIKAFSIKHVNVLNQEELENIITMKNLKNLTLDNIKESHVDFETITDTSNIRRLELNIIENDIALTPNFFKIFSQMEEFIITGHTFNQEEIDGFKTLENLKEMVVFDNYCKDYIQLDVGSLLNIMNFKNSYDYNFRSCIYEPYPIEDTVYIYNANRNKCLSASKNNTNLYYGNCNNPENILWHLPDTGLGVIHYGLDKKCCLAGTFLHCGKTCIYESSYIMVYTSNNKIINFQRNKPGNLCLGSKDENSDRVVTKICDNNDPDQIWYYNKWDPSVVIKETAIVYFYNAYKNECIITDGSSVTTGDCEFNDNTLWEIPNSHKGYYRSKANPEKCLSIVDGVVSLNECNENTTLYLDGNFIRSPLSKDHCIASSKSDNTLEHVENCDISNTDHIWYVNIWTPEN